MLRALTIALLLLSSTGLRGEKFYVYFSDKAGAQFDPYEYFSEAAIQRRLKCGIPLVQHSDLPVNEDYLTELSARVDSITAISRWLNMACVYTTASIEAIEHLPFVKRVEQAEPSEVHLSRMDTMFGDATSALKYFQCERMHGSYFREKGLRGNGVTIAVLDAGFKGVKEHQSFARVDIIGARDFIRNDDNPYRGASHGEMVLACMAGRDWSDSTYLGLAPKAKYLLARTERFISDGASEEEYWVLAAEWADKMGADIINTSLGYSGKRYRVEDMNGRTAIVSRAAGIAFSKGIVVIASAGNEGENRWHYITAPADADSVLSIGGVNPYTDVKSHFSSLGPNANYATKPNLCAYGRAYVPSGRDWYVEGAGTSFSAPLVSGFVACLIQAFPAATHKEIFERVQSSGHLYPYFDYAHGFGIPIAEKALGAGTAPAQDSVITFLVGSGWLLASVTEDKFPELDTTALYRRNMYYHVMNSQGRLVAYSVFPLDNSKEKYLLNLLEYSPGNIVRVFFEGYISTYRIK